MCLGQHLARSKAGYLIKNGISPLTSVQFLLKRGLALFMLIANYNALLSPLFSKAVHLILSDSDPCKMFLSVEALTPGTKQMPH